MADNIKIPIIYEDQGLDHIFNRLNELEQSVSSLAESQKKAFETIVKAIKSYDSSLESLREEIFQVNIKIEDNTASLDKNSTQLSRSQKLIDKYGKSLVNLANKVTIFGHGLGDLGKRAIRMVKNFGRMTKAARLFRIALISTGIGAIVVALGSFIGMLAKGSKAVDVINSALTAVGTTVNVITDRLSLLGDAIVKVFQGDFIGAAKDAKLAMSGIGQEIREEGKLMIELQNRKKRLTNAERNLTLEISNQRKQIEERRDVVNDTNKSFDERRKILSEVSKQENDLQAQQLANAREALRIAKKEEGTRKENKEDIDKLISLQKEVAEIEADIAAKKRADSALLSSINRQEAAEAKRRAAEAKRRAEEAARIREKLQSDLDNITKKIRDQIVARELSRLSEEDRLKRQSEIAAAELQQLEVLALQKAVALGKSEEEQQEIRDSFAELQLANEQALLDKLIELDLAAEEKAMEAALKAEINRKAQQDKAFAERLAYLDKEQEIALAEIELFNENTDEILTLEQVKELKRLEVRLEGLKARKALIDQEFGQDSQESRLLSNQIKKLEQDIAKFDQIDLSGLDKFKNKLLSALGVSEEELQQISQTASLIFKEATELAIKDFDNQIKILDAQIAETDKRISEIQGKLSEAQDLEDRGLANNTKRLKEELDKQEKIKKDAEAKRRKAENEKARQQLRLNALQTASSVVLSVAKLLATEAGKGIVGIITAVAGVATIFATIASAKKQAEALKEPEQFGEGGRVGGKLHKHGGTIIEAEKDEYVVRRKVSMANYKFLENLNNGKYNGLDLDRTIAAGLLPHPLRNASADIAQIQKSQQAAQKEVQKEVLREVFAANFGELKKEVQELAHAILSKPDRVPVTDGGYIEFTTEGNVSTRNHVVFEEED